MIRNRFLYIIVAAIMLGLALFFYGGNDDNAKNQPSLDKNATVSDMPRVMVLNYHQISDRFHSLAVSPTDFATQLEFLKNNNYHAITPDDLYNAMESGTALPENPVLITFDDGYEDNFINAYPLLEKYNFKATIFVVTSFIGKKKNYLTWEQVKKLDAEGYSIESHTVTHRSMTDLSDDDLRYELTESKAKLEEELGHAIDYIAYPTGTYNLHIAQLVKEAGYKAAFTIKYGNADGMSNVYAIERVPIFHTENTMRDFYERIRYTPIFSKFGWSKN